MIGLVGAATVAFVGAEHGVSRAVVALPAPDVVAIIATRMAARIADGDLAEKGRETDFHVTARWGFTNDEPDGVAEILARTAPFVVSLGRTSVFRGDGYDVVKVDVESQALRQLNADLGVLGHEETFDYAPHLTLAYVKSGLGEKYVGMLDLDGKGWAAREAVFSSSTEERTTLSIGSLVATIELVGAAKGPSRYRLSKFAREHAAELVDAPKKVQKIIREEVTKALKNGEGPKGIADRLFGEIDRTPEEIDRIAQTEYVIARTGAKLEQFEVDAGDDADAGKAWVLGKDGCPLCAAIADAGPVPLGDPFIGPDGEEFDGPPAHPFCDCDVEEVDLAESKLKAAIAFVGAE